MATSPDWREMLSYYEGFDEADRLAKGKGLLEFAALLSADAGDSGIPVLPSVQSGHGFQYAQRHVLDGHSPK